MSMSVPKIPLRIIANMASVKIKGSVIVVTVMMGSTERNVIAKRRIQVRETQLSCYDDNIH